ncbi:MAG TPA: hypothetical protein VNN98_07395 [Rhizomicrobium sp.]|nr:hypothetical protein [Rhizomicrobium sp.]
MRKSIAAALLALAAFPAPALAWGGAGHRMIGELAARNFPKDIPAFLKSPVAVWQIGELAQEPDISRNAGQPHDADSDPGHFLDVSDDGSILGGPKLPALPATRRDYDTALRAVKSDEYKAGFLPYAIMDGWQQLVKDFALLRRDMAALKYARKFAMTAAEKKSYAESQAVRQILTLRDLGVWAHYVGDGSQPLHASVHYNGWGEGPNPQGFVVTPGLHAKFESDFVNANITEKDVAAVLRPYGGCGCTIQQQTQNYLLATAAQVVPTYELEKAGAFDSATPAAKEFAAQRIAEGAAMLRDMVTDAWQAAGAATLGYKSKESVADIEAGKADPRKLD